MLKQTRSFVGAWGKIDRGSQLWFYAAHTFSTVMKQQGSRSCRRQLLVVIAFLASAAAAHSQLVLNAGDVYTHSFSSLPALGCFGPIPSGARDSGNLSFTLDPASIQPGDSFQMEIGLSGMVVVWNGPGSPQSLSAVTFGPPGGITLTGLSGSVTFSTITMSASVRDFGLNGVNQICQYGATFVPVPEPGTISLIGLAASLLVVRVVRRK